MTTALICVRGYRINEVLDAAQRLLAPDLAWVIAHIIDERPADELARALEGLPVHGTGQRHVEERLRQTIEEQQQAISDDVQAWLSAQARAAEIIISHGRPDEEILRLARSHAVDLIVLGSSPPTGGPIRLSPPVQFITNHAECAVLVLRRSE